MPCLNEARSLAPCIAKAQKLIATRGLNAEIVIADNGSTDGSQDLARSQGARVVDVATRGYGHALAAGIAGARGEIVVMADSDDSYDFSEAGPLIDALEAGADLVMGNRFTGNIRPGAMPFSHRYFGVPLLSWLARVLYGSCVGDFHCGLRVFSREAILNLKLQTGGMEYASEMIIRASLAGLKIAELPVTLYPDARGGRPPHLRTWPDGWRHLKFLLAFFPQRFRAR